MSPALQAQSPTPLVIDSIISSTPPQHIILVKIPGDGQETLQADIVISEGHPMTTSAFGSEENAVLSVNGSFFNTKTYEMVTYYEQDNRVERRNVSSSGPSLFNGIVIIDHEGKLRLEPLTQESFYVNSLQEKEAVAAGPLLLKNAKRTPLPDRPAFTLKRHPRSCLCITDDAVLVIAIDGRSNRASGMTLPELQDFLIEQKCRDAINLDGGGSTSIWVKGLGVLNHPSDEAGERKVVNAVVWKMTSSAPEN
ncbi:phosphodiester glycosidase family protein [Robertkochia marina]|nr:phosphodiester glycosidase family protein [Robertkochia marina]